MNEAPMRHTLDRVRHLCGRRGCLDVEAFGRGGA
jgi:hypothetical protein